MEWYSRLPSFLRTAKEWAPEADFASQAGFFASFAGLLGQAPFTQVAAASALVIAGALAFRGERRDLRAAGLAAAADAGDTEEEGGEGERREGDAPAGSAEEDRDWGETRARQADQAGVIGEGQAGDREEACWEGG